MPVHSAYERYRKGLLAMGAEIYEARPDAFQVMGLYFLPHRFSWPVPASNLTA